jgi:hypothetical protein
VLCDVSRIYGFKGKWDIEPTLDHWLLMVEQVGGDWVKVAKYKLAAFFAYHTDQPLPPSPCPVVKDSPGQLAGGRLGRFLQLQMSTLKGLERLSLLASLKQAKKGMPRVTKRTLKQEEEKFRVVMTTPSEPPQKPKSTVEVTTPKGVRWSEVEDEKTPESLSQTEIEIELDRTVDELFKGVSFTTDERLRAVFPSTSANYIRTRSRGGAVGAILEHPTLLSGLRVAGGYGTVEEQPGERKRVEEEEEHISNSEWIRKPGESTPAYRDAHQTFWLRLLKLASREDPIVEPVALAEPLKVRIITKGPPFTQTLLEALRRKMHDTLRDHPAFKLIGEMVTEKYLLDRLGRELGSDQEFLSGDYRAATDNLFSWVSNRIANRIADRLKLYEVERRKFQEALTGHLIEVTDPVTGETELKRQQRGQLMGSNVSFPVLCIAVATVARCACEYSEKRKLTLKQAPIMINGDDNATKCRPEGLKYWRTMGRCMGLEESVGKSYFSRRFVEINSTIFHYDRKSTRGFLEPIQPDGRRPFRQQPFEQVRYVNMGLLTGQKRSGGAVSLRDKRNPGDDLGARYRKLLELAPPTVTEKLHRAFIFHHSELLTAVHPIPWNLPTWIGGLGMLGVIPYSDKDLRIARMILLNWKHKRPADLGTVREVPWKVWRLAEARVNEPDYTEEKDSNGEKVYLEAMATACIDILFDSNLKLCDIHPDVNPDEIEQGRSSELQRMIHHNQELWSPARYKRGLGPPIDPERLTFRALYPTYRRNAISGDNNSSSSTDRLSFATTLD